MSEIHTRSKENVKEHGEVFTPSNIVKDMAKLIPDEAWEDPEFCFLEPACGNGNILVEIYKRRVIALKKNMKHITRLENRNLIEHALNTMIGMDISKENIFESHFEIYKLVSNNMRRNCMMPGLQDWKDFTVRIIAIVYNNNLQKYLFY